MVKIKIMLCHRTLVPPIHTTKSKSLREKKFASNFESSAFQSYLGTFLKEYKEASIKDVKIEKVPKFLMSYMISTTPSPIIS